MERLTDAIAVLQQRLRARWREGELVVRDIVTATAEEFGVSEKSLGGAARECLTAVTKLPDAMIALVVWGTEQRPRPTEAQYVAEAIRLAFEYGLLPWEGRQLRDASKTFAWEDYVRWIRERLVLPPAMLTWHGPNGRVSEEAVEAIRARLARLSDEERLSNLEDQELAADAMECDIDIRVEANQIGQLLSKLMDAGQPITFNDLRKRAIYLPIISGRLKAKSDP